METVEGCPKCGEPGFRYDYEEVDVGIGTITCLRGGDCEHCRRLSTCISCGVWENTQHEEWCDA